MCSSSKKSAPPAPPPVVEKAPEPDPVVNPGGKSANDLTDGTPPDPVEFARRQAAIDDDAQPSLIGSLGTA